MLGPNLLHEIHGNRGETEARAPEESLKRDKDPWAVQDSDEPGWLYKAPPALNAHEAPCVPAHRPPTGDYALPMT